MNTQTILLRAAALAAALSATTACLTSLTPPPPSAADKTLPTANAAALEDLAIAQMREIKRAEDSRIATRGSYGTIDDLVRDKDLGRPPSSNRYAMTLTLADGGSGYTLVAVPREYGSDGRRSFFMDQTGLIRGTDHMGKPATASDPPVR